MKLPDGTLYAIVDPSRCDGGISPNRADPIEQFTRAVIRGGADVVQLRDKEGTARQTHYLATHMADVCAECEVPFVVNDRVDVALTSGADGVHVGPEDVPVEAIRSLVGEDFIVGGSAGTPEAAEELQKQGADYLGVGAIYPARRSKPDASRPKGPQAVRDVVETVDIPVVGIGGIDASNAAEVVEHGARGVAVIRALTDPRNPEEAARRLSGAMES